MRRGLLAIPIVVSATIACHYPATAPAGVLLPETLSIKDVEVGDSQSIDLSLFTFNGLPLADATFSLSDDQRGVFVLTTERPLSAPPQLAFAPRQVRDYAVVLSVVTHGRTYAVPVTANGLPQPRCVTSGDLCAPQVFDAASGGCVTKALPDGLECSRADCVSNHVCRSGVCTAVPRPDAVPLCQHEGSATILSPAWTFTPEAGRTLIFGGLVDSSGNLYLLDCPAGQSTASACDVLSLSPDGELRWRAATSTTFRVSSQAQLRIIGERLFLAEPDSQPVPIALRLSDGGVAWRQDAALPLSLLTAAGPNLAAAVSAITDHSRAKPSTVVLFDADTGVERRRFNDVAPGDVFSMVSDGQGGLYLSSISDDGSTGEKLTLTALNIERGLLWRAMLLSAETIVGVDGTRVYLSNGEVHSVVDGKLLYTTSRGYLWLNPAQETGVTSEAMLGQVDLCVEATMRRIRLSDGVQEGGCRMEEDGAPILLASPLLTMQDGGMAFLAMKNNLPTLERVDQDGHTRLTAHLNGFVFPSEQPYYFAHPPALVGSRWMMSSSMATNRSAVVAYDVPGLALAEHGWLMPGGNQARNGAPW